MKRSATRWVLSGFAFCVSAGAVALGLSAARDMPRHVSAGGHKLRMSITGAGSPAVILETFGPAYLEAWNRIQPGIARIARVVAYDHAGYWGSEPGPKPRDATRIARELRTALHNANVSPPYVLVGYSFGGPYTRVFASLYPDEVKGLVFVDPTQEDFMAWLNRRFPKMNVVTEADRRNQDEWGSQWLSLNQARNARLPEVPMTLLSAAQTEGVLSRKLVPLWCDAHATWLRQFPGARHILTTNSGHGIVFTEPQLIIDAVREMVRQARPPVGFDNSQ